jgi:large subunit ribosomal protein L18
MNTKLQRRQKIKWTVRKKISGTPECPRLSVFRSNSSIYLQLIDDTTGTTLCAATSKQKDIADLKGTKLEQASNVGKAIAAKAIAKGIVKVVFDRSGYLYHGRIKNAAEGAREGGLKF